MLSETTRAWIYRVFTAVTIVLVFYGIISEQEALVWGTALTSLIGNTLATINTTTK
jgi:hypothetical protein